MDMRRCTTIFLLLVALLVTSCASPRKAEARRHNKAARFVAKAIMLDPSILKTCESTTYTIPADSATFTAKTVVVNVDSLLAACAELNAALSVRPPEEVPVYRDITKVIDGIKRKACAWEGFTEHFGRTLTITVSNVDGTPVLTVDQSKEVVQVPCPPRVERPQIVPKCGVAEWYRTFTWLILGLALLLIVYFAYKILR